MKATEAHLPPILQDEALIDIKTVCALTGFKAPSPIYDRIRDGLFPPPIRLSSRCSRWKVSVIRAWIAAQQAQAGAPVQTPSAGRGGA